MLQSASEVTLSFVTIISCAVKSGREFSPLLAPAHTTGLGLNKQMSDLLSALLAQPLERTSTITVEPTVKQLPSEHTEVLHS